MKNFVIYTKMLGVAVWLFEKVNTFPKKQRFVLGQQIENSSLLCIRIIIEANFSQGTNVKAKKLRDLNIELEVLRSLVRMAVELNFMKINSAQYITASIDEVGKMTGAWLKKI